MTKISTNTRGSEISHISHKQNNLASAKKKTLAISSAISMDDNKGEYIVYVAVPGMQRKDFSITINKKILTVAAVKTEAMHCFSVYDEQAFPEWKETFTLPEDADTVMTAAVYRNGELEIHIPKGKTNFSDSPVEVFVY
jgi:HSP20 family protein